MIIGRLQASGRATIPQEVRNALNLKEGDLLRYEIDGDRVSISKSRDDEDSDQVFSNEELQPIIDAALADIGETFSCEEVFAELHARIDAHRGRKDAA